MKKGLRHEWQVLNYWDKRLSKEASRLKAEFDGNTIKDNRDLRRIANEIYESEQGADPDLNLKRAQEDLEMVVATKARDIMESDATEAQKNTQLVQLYEKQPRLNVRTGGSSRKQSLFDTRSAGRRGRQAHRERSAVIATGPENATVNEIDAARAERLENQGFTVTRDDALEKNAGPADRSQDVVLANPPFGAMEGKRKTVSFDG